MEAGLRRHWTQERGGSVSRRLLVVQQFPFKEKHEQPVLYAKGINLP